MKKNAWIAGVTAVMTAGLIFTNPVSVRAEEVIPAGVYVGSLSLEGLTEKEAEDAVKTYVEEKLDQDVTLDVNGAQAKASAEELGLSWGNTDAVAEAVEGSKLSGNLIKRYMKQKDLQENPLRIDLDMNVDEEKVSAFVSEKCGAAVAEAQDATIVRENGEFIITVAVFSVL